MLASIIFTLCCCVQIYLIQNLLLEPMTVWSKLSKRPVLGENSHSKLIREREYSDWYTCLCASSSHWLIKNVQEFTGVRVRKPGLIYHRPITVTYPQDLLPSLDQNTITAEQTGQPEQGNWEGSPGPKKPHPWELFKSARWNSCVAGERSLKKKS